MIKEYSDEEHDFGIDYNVVASLTKMTPEESKSIISALAKSETGMYVDCVTRLYEHILTFDDLFFYYVLVLMLLRCLFLPSVWRRAERGTCLVESSRFSISWTSTEPAKLQWTKW